MSREAEEKYREAMEYCKPENGINLREALLLSEEAAKLGHGEAALFAGNLFLYGEPQIQINTKKGIKYFQQAIDDGIVGGKYALALCYYSGKGVEKDTKKAFTLAKEAFDNGYQFAAVFLRSCYEEGIGTEKDHLEALKYNEIARRFPIPYGEIEYARIICGKNKIS